MLYASFYLTTLLCHFLSASSAAVPHALAGTAISTSSGDSSSDTSHSLPSTTSLFRRNPSEIELKGSLKFDGPEHGDHEMSKKDVEWAVGEREDGIERVETLSKIAMPALVSQPNCRSKVPVKGVKIDTIAGLPTMEKDEEHFLLSFTVQGWGGPQHCVYQGYFDWLDGENVLTGDVSGHFISAGGQLVAKVEKTVLTYPKS
ncbi:hypothetical protein C8R42DRAFT_660360 [Lentinula raphanica]|nr:hypothetical protein C8R42DRAFT_660360 [Lentinula raphanica]